MSFRRWTDWEIWKHLRRGELISFFVLFVIGIGLLLVTHFLAANYKAHEQVLGKRWFARGEREMAANRPLEAIADFRNALLYSRENQLIQIRLAQALSAANRTDEARAYFLSLWDQEPGSGLINLELARLAARKGDSSQVLQFYHGAIYGAWEEDPIAHRTAARFELIEHLLHEDGRAQAQAELIVLQSGLPVDPSLQLRAAALFMVVPDYANALKLYRLVLKEDEKNPEALAGAGEASFQLHQYRTAESFLQEAVAAGATDPHLQTLVDTTAAVRQLDPFGRGISESQRAARVVEAFRRAGDRLQQCAQKEGVDLAATPPKNDLQLQSAQWVKIQSSVNARRLRNSEDLRNDVMDLVFQIESRTEACGNKTTTDTALGLIAKDREGVDR